MKKEPKENRSFKTINTYVKMNGKIKLKKKNTETWGKCSIAKEYWKLGKVEYKINLFESKSFL